MGFFDEIKKGVTDFALGPVVSLGRNVARRGVKGALETTARQGVAAAAVVGGIALLGGAGGGAVAGTAGAGGGGISAGAAIGGLSLVANIVGGVLSNRAAKRAARAEQAAVEANVKAQFSLSSQQIEAKAVQARQGLEIRAGQLDIQERLQRAQLRVQGDITLARSRSKGQVSRTGGFGGSLSEARSGRPELQAEIQRGVERIDFERGVRLTARIREENRINLDEFFAQSQAQVTGQAQTSAAKGRGAAAVTAADATLASNLIGAGFDFATNTAVQDAIGGFFDNAPKATRTDVVAVKTTTE